MALTRHHATNRHKRRGAKSKFVRAKNRANQDVAGEAHAAIDAQGDSRTQARAQQAFRACRANRFPTAGRCS